MFADTHASALYTYPYDGATGAVGSRRVFADTSQLDGMPDGACADTEGGVWSCVLGAGTLARYTSGGLQQQIETTVELPSDATFGGHNFERLFFVSIAVAIGDVTISSPNAGALMVADGCGHRGRPEPRFCL